MALGKRAGLTPQSNRDFIWDTVYGPMVIPNEELALTSSTFLLTHSRMRKLKETVIFDFMK